MFGFKTFDRLKKLHDEREALLNIRSRMCDEKQAELDVREKRIAEREEMHMVRLTVAKHPLLAAPYGAQDNFAVLRAANIARNPEWFPDGAPPVLPASFRGLELAGEVGEGVEAALTHLAMLTASAGRICNILKKLERERLGLNGSRSTEEALAEELGDFIICADLVGMDFDIPLWPSVVSKFNATSNKLGMKTLLPTPEQTGDWSQSTYTPEQTPYWTRPQWQAAEEQTCKTFGVDVEEEHRMTCDECGGDGNMREPPGLCMACNGDGWTYR